MRCDKNLSDHYLTFCNVIGYNSASPQETIYVIKNKPNFNAELYCDELSCAITSFLLNENELTEANFDNYFTAFTSSRQTVINKHALLKQLSRNQKKNLSQGLQRYAKIHTKRRMHKTHYISDNKAIKQEYKIFANKLTKLKAIAKKKLSRKRA